MQGRLERLSLLAAPLAVVCWIVGLVVTNTFSDKIPDHATDEQLLSWVQGNTNSILFGGWLFMIGCLALVWSLRFFAVDSPRPRAGRPPSRTSHSPVLPWPRCSGC